MSNVTTPEVPQNRNANPVSPHLGRNANFALAAVLAACVIRLWLMPLASSFWVDEMGTSFVVGHGAGDPSLRIAPQVAASIYYALPELSIRLLGQTEFAYRLPSVLAIALSLALAYRLGGRLIHPAAGWFAVFACLALQGFNYQAADARPYALGTCMVCAAMWCLVRWLDSARWLDALAFGAAASLVWRVHMIFWPVYLAFALYTLARILGGRTEVAWWHAVLIFSAIGISLIPVAAAARELLRHAAAHVVVPLPSGSELGNSLKLGPVVGFAAAAAFVGRWRRWPMVEDMPRWESLTLIGAWWLCPPLCLFAFSWLTRDSVFVARYLAIGLPGTALAAAAVAAFFIPPQHWRRVSLILGLGILVFLGQWGRLWPAHHNSDWRDAARAIAGQHLGPDVPVIAPSPFIEARPPVWHPDYPVDTFLYSNLLTYRFSGQIYTFPFERSPEASAYALRLAGQTLPRAGRFVLYGSDRSVEYWRNWFEARPELIGWASRRLGPFGDVDVVVFGPPQQAAAPSPTTNRQSARPHS